MIAGNNPFVVFVVFVVVVFVVVVFVVVVFVVFVVVVLVEFPLTLAETVPTVVVCPAELALLLDVATLDAVV